MPGPYESVAQILRQDPNAPLNQGNEPSNNFDLIVQKEVSCSLQFKKRTYYNHEVGWVTITFSEIYMDPLYDRNGVAITVLPGDMFCIDNLYYLVNTAFLYKGSHWEIEASHGMLTPTQVPS